MSNNIKIDTFKKDFDESESFFVPSSDHSFTRIVVKVSTSYWQDKRGIHQKKSIEFLKRLCVGMNGLLEDANADVECTFLSVVNLGQCEDGVYQAVINSTSLDWESGIIDAWDWKLIPYKTSEGAVHEQ